MNCRCHIWHLRDSIPEFTWLMIEIGNPFQVGLPVLYSYLYSNEEQSLFSPVGRDCRVTLAMLGAMITSTWPGFQPNNPKPVVAP